MRLEPPTATEDGDIEVGGVHFACPPYASIWIDGWQVYGGVVAQEGRQDIGPWSEEKRQQYDQQAQRSQSRFARILRRVPVRRVRRRFVHPGPPWQVTITNNAFTDSEPASWPRLTEAFPPFDIRRDE